jgi:crotonobetainyl-CoA:carnitine CoA-transferase CaiB-like acyl-CoA transferase
MKLEGIRVIDLSSFLPGPYLTLAMADHGAEVIKVEAPAGDPGREIGLRVEGQTVFFTNLNRGKRSLCLDLKTQAGRDTLLALCDGADVFVESFRPGVMARLGLDPATLRQRNPRLVYCSISAFGQTGEWRNRPAHDLSVEAMSGVLSLAAGADGMPAIPPIPVADVLAGLHGLSGVLMALLKREQTGRGDHLDISMFDSTLGASLNILGPTFAEDRQPVAQHERTTGGSAFYRVYETQDGRYLTLGGQEEKFVRTLLDALDRPDLIPLVLKGPGPHQAPVAAFLAQTFASQPLAAWEQRLGALDVCFGAVRTLPEAFADPHTVRRHMVLHDERGHRHVGSPIHFADEPAQPRLQAPALNEFAPELAKTRTHA